MGNPPALPERLPEFDSSGNRRGSRMACPRFGSAALEVPLWQGVDGLPLGHGIAPQSRAAPRQAKSGALGTALQSGRRALRDGRVSRFERLTYSKPPALPEVPDFLVV